MAPDDPDDHVPYPIDWHPFNEVHCGECGRPIITDLPAEGETARWEHA